MARTTWNAGAVEDHIRDAVRRAIDETTAACVARAKSNHPWKNRTGTLEGSIQMRPAQAGPEGIRGEWGSYNVRYALFQEIGTSRMRARPYLRPAAQIEYPRLPDRIRRNLGGRR
jgi:HK97 gp10 family phage protein